MGPMNHQFDEENAPLSRRTAAQGGASLAETSVLVAVTMLAFLGVAEIGRSIDTGDRSPVAATDAVSVRSDTFAPTRHLISPRGVAPFDLAGAALAAPVEGTRR